MASSSKAGQLRLLASSFALAGVLHGSVAPALQAAAPTDPSPTTKRAPAATAPSAPTDTAALRERAREAYGAGQTAYSEGRYAAAEAHFAQADSLLPSVQAKYWRAMSLDQLGNAAAAREALGQVLASPEKDQLGAEKLGSAEARYRELESAPATLAITTTPPGARVSVSGIELQSPTPTVVKLAPGRHVLRISMDGYETQEVELTASPGAKLEPSITLVPAPPATTPIPEGLSPPPAEAPRGPEPRSKVPGYVTLGIAGASAVVGTVFGLRALADKNKFEDDPTTRHADDVERNALIADMAFGVALTLGITGIVLLVADDTTADEARAALTQRAQLRVLPMVSPDGAGAAASFQF